MTTRPEGSAAATARITLYRGGVVHSPAASLATALVIADDKIAWMGSDQEAVSADRLLD